MAEPTATGRDDEAPGYDQRVVVPGRPDMLVRHYGDPNGTPVLMLHGTPGSRFKFSSTDETARKLHLHIIAPDRWSYGGTAAPADPSLEKFAQWAGAAMAALGYDRFAVGGISGGGPYATAVAALLPKRVIAAALISPVGLVADAKAASEVDAFHRFCFDHLPKSPRSIAAIFRLYEIAVRRAPSLAARLTVLRAPKPDKLIMADPGTRARLLRTFAEGLRESARGPSIDLALFREIATLDLGRIVAPTHVWIGTRDTNVPVTAAKRLASRIPNATLTVLPDEGHLWAAKHYDEILGWIAEAVRPNG